MFKVSKLKNNNRGSILMMTLIILAVLTAASLVIGRIIINEIYNAKNIDNSLSAFYAAETGVEDALYQLRKNNAGSADLIIPQIEGGPLQELSPGSGASWKRDIKLIISDSRDMTANTTLTADIDCTSVSVCEVKIQCLSCAASPCWVEMTFVNLDLSIADDMRVRRVLRGLKCCETTGCDNETTESSYLRNGEIYQLRLTPLADVTGLKFSSDADEESQSVYEAIRIDSTGLFSTARQALSISMPYRTQPYGFYDYVIFSEEDLLK